MKKRSECNCHCHTFGGKHIVPCCFEDTMVSDPITPEPEWVSVNEQTPSLNESVFVLDNEGVFIGFWNGYFWHDISGRDCGEVTHWMPIELPAMIDG